MPPDTGIIVTIAALMLQQLANFDGRVICSPVVSHTEIHDC